MPAKFVVKKGTTGKFRFSLVAPNGQVVASSEAYETKRAALGGIASVQKIAAGAAVEDLTAPKAPAKPAAAAAKKPAAKKPVAKAAAAKAPARKPAAKKPVAKRAAAK